MTDSQDPARPVSRADADLASRVTGLEASFAAWNEFYERDRREAKRDREKLDAKLDAIDDKVDGIKQRQDEHRGRLAVLGAVVIGIPAAVGGWLVNNLLGGPGQ